MLYRWLNETVEASNYWHDLAQRKSSSVLSLMLTMWAVEEVSKLPPSMVRDAAMLTLQCVEWDVLTRAINEGNPEISELV